ncbi:MAG: hypothetical protein P4L72_17025 [Parvibaculum sp.]|uniref:hypothetical protein n=1 Tax=Parvibaculum sp. TaxID=2024848 RepID=UPI002840AB32|nr:hypothetical protein [Parvibaculum sp.]MDR3500919.1 hypothetical protein [Parvibaculum sp.]
MLKIVYFVTGLVLPIRTTSRLYLADRLSQHGVKTRRIPKACLQELADDAVASVKRIAAISHRGWREIVTDHLDGHAVNVANIIDGTLRDDLTMHEYNELIRETLRRHGVPFLSA